MTSDRSRSAVVLSVTGTGGDIMPLITIGRHLAGRGYGVTLISHAPFQRRAEVAGLEFVSMDTVEEYQRLLDCSASLVGRSYDLDAVERAVGWYHTPQRREREFVAVAERVAARPAAVLARYVSNTAAIVAAERYGAARAWSLVSPHALAEGAALSTLHGDWYRDRLNRERAQFELPPVDDWYAWMSSVAVRIGLWADWFAPDTVGEPNAAIVGFVREDPGGGGPLAGRLWDYLAEGEPPVLVTAGTGKMLAPGFHQAAVSGSLRAGRRIVLVGQHVDEPRRWPARSVFRLPEAPLANLLPHVATVIHHGGVGTLAQALAVGVPQLVLAEGVDRPDNADRLCRLGVAEALPPVAWTPGAVAAALQRLADPSVRQRAAGWARSMREWDPTAEAGRRVEELIRNQQGGSGSTGFS